MKLLVESIRRISLPRYVVRVWRREPSDYEHSAKGLGEIELVAYQHQEGPLRELCDKLLEVANVTAVEVVDWNQQGIFLTNNERRSHE